MSGGVLAQPIDKLLHDVNTTDISAQNRGYRRWWYEDDDGGGDNEDDGSGGGGDMKVVVVV